MEKCCLILLLEITASKVSSFSTVLCNTIKVYCHYLRRLYVPTGVLTMQSILTKTQRDLNGSQQKSFSVALLQKPTGHCS